MDMVEILLGFIRSSREGNWNLRLETFGAMLPWFAIYDHSNYSRWGPVHLADMKNLEQYAPDIHREFTAGNFVVKMTRNMFNQVPLDQATEWMNRICKISNGIIGITKNDQARDRFCATWSERSHVSHDTKLLYGLVEEDEADLTTRKDAVSSIKERDEEAVQKLMSQFDRFNVFFSFSTEVGHAESEPVDSVTPQLVSLATKDIATMEITENLLSAEKRGKHLVTGFVNERLVSKSVLFYRRQNTETFGTLYKTTVTTKADVNAKVIKADRTLLQRLFVASQAGRHVSMEEILKHKLSPLPLSLTKINGEMHSAAKSELATLVTKEIGIEPKTKLSNSEERTCVLIDGHALIQAIGKTDGCSNFGEYASVFFQLVIQKI